MLWLMFLVIAGVAAWYELYGQKRWLKKMAGVVIFLSSFAALYSMCTLAC